VAIVGQLGFYFNMQACIGCRTCQIACKDKNDLPMGKFYRHVRSFEGGQFPNPFAFNLPSTCNHCADPACVRACPTGAMHKADDGTVQHDDDACIGCRSCMSMCPYDVPQFFEDLGIVGKCNACIDLRESGGNPACVDACVMRCLEFGPLDELRAKHEGEDLTAALSVLPTPEITSPSLLVNPSIAVYSGSSSEAFL
jgi:anaerobic dimethyl sulfoxide reductase subunit B (iron-sulfur subunit)